MRDFDMVNRLLFVAIVLLTVLVAVALLYTFLTFGVLGLIGGVIITPLAMVVVLKAFRAMTITVPEGTVTVVERMGAFSRILYPGSSLLLDPFDKVKANLPTTELQYEFTANDVLVGASAKLKLSTLVRYRISRRLQEGREIPDEQAIYRAVYEVADWDSAIKRQCEATLRDVMGETGWRDEFIGVSASGDTIIARPRSRINAKVRFLLDREAQRWGLTITRVSVQIIHVDDESLNSAFAIRRARKRGEIMRIEAQNEKEKKIREFEAELARIKMQAAAIREGMGTADFVALKWIEAIERLAGDTQSKWVIPVEFLQTVRQITSMMQGTTPSEALPEPPVDEIPPHE